MKFIRRTMLFVIFIRSSADLRNVNFNYDFKRNFLPTFSIRAEKEYRNSYSRVVSGQNKPLDLKIMALVGLLLMHHFYAQFSNIK